MGTIYRRPKGFVVSADGRRNISEAMKELYRKERERVANGRPQRTGLRVVSHKKEKRRQQYWSELGYHVCGDVVYYDLFTMRSDVIEARASRYGVRFVERVYEEERLV